MLSIYCDRNMSFVFPASTDISFGKKIILKKKLNKEYCDT